MARLQWTSVLSISQTGQCESKKARRCTGCVCLVIVPSAFSVSQMPFWLKELGPPESCGRDIHRITQRPVAKITIVIFKFNY